MDLDSDIGSIKKYKCGEYKMHKRGSNYLMPYGSLTIPYINSVTIKLVELDIMINDIAIVVYTYDDSKNN